VKAIARETLWDAIKVTVVATITFFLAPQISICFPDVPELVVYLATAFVTAFVLLIIYAVLFWRAVVIVEWVRAGDSAPLTELDVKFSSSRFSQESYVVRVSPGRATGLGWLAVQLACRTGLCVDARALHSPTLIVVEEVDFDEKHGELARSQTGSGLRIALTAPVPPEDHWQIARVRFQAGKDTRGTRVSTLRHRATGTNPISWLCARLIRVETKAARVRTRWS
jgi:hypothetical protein